MSSPLINTSPITIDFNNLDKSKQLELKQFDAGSWQLKWEKQHSLWGGHYFKANQKFEFSIKIKDYGLVQEHQGAQRDIKTQLKVSNWDELVQIAIAYSTDSTTPSTSTKHDHPNIELNWALPKSKLSDKSPLIHPYHLLINPGCIQDLELDNQATSNFYLKFNIEVNNLFPKNDLQLIPVQVPLRFIHLKAQPQLGTELDHNSGVSFKGQDEEKIGVCTIENDPRAGIHFVETFDGSLSINCVEYPQALRFKLDDDRLTDTIDSLIIQAFAPKTRYALVLDFKKIPLFWQDKELEYTLIATSGQDKVESTQSIRIKAFQEPPQVTFPKTECSINFDSSKEPWQVIKHEKFRNEFFAVHKELIDVKISLEDTQLLKDLNLSSSAQFLHFKLDQEANHQSFVADYAMSSPEMPFSIWLNTDPLRTYQSETGRIELKVLLSYRLGHDIHPQKLFLPIELKLNKAAPNFTATYLAKLSSIDLTQSYQGRLSLGEIILRNKPSAAIAEPYTTKIGLRAADKYLAAALSFVTHEQKEQELELPPHTEKSLEVFLDTSLLKYDAQRELTFEVYDNKQNKVVHSEKLTFMPVQAPKPIKRDNLNPINHDFNDETQSYSLICELPIRPVVAGMDLFRRVQIVDFSIGEQGNGHGIKFGPGGEANLFTLAFQGEVKDTLFNLNLNANPPVPLSVHFNHKAILDFAGDQAEVPFWIKIEAEEAAGLGVETYSIESKVVFKKRAAKLGLEIKLHEGAEGKLPYNSGSKVEIGMLRVKNDTPVDYTEPLNVRLEAKIRSEENPSVAPNIVSFQEPGYDYPKGALELEERAFNLLLTKENGELEIPILLNLDDIESQQKDVEYVLEVKERLKSEVFEKEFIIKKYETSTKFSFQVKKSKVEKVKEDESKQFFTFERPKMWKGDDHIDLRLFTFSLGNLASQHGKGQILIKSIASVFTPPAVEIKLRDGRSWNDLIFVSSEGGKKENFNTFFEHFQNKPINDGQKPIDLTISLRQTGIAELSEKVETFTFKFNISYTLKTDAQKSGKDFEENYSIKVPIRKDLGSEWLAIDFGTSAIVAAFGDDAGDSSLLRINFETHLMRIKNTTLPEENEATSVPSLDEASMAAVHKLSNDKHLLPSAMILLQLPGEKNKEKEKEKEMFGERLEDCLVDISPNPETLAFFAKENGLPYLKSLIGAKSLLDGNRKLDGKKYLENINDVKLLKTISVDGPPIIDIVKATYWVLLQHFIKPIVKQKGKALNKIVLTIPNSYTRVHINNLRESIIGAMSDLDPENVEFVSESDAIAFRYYAIRRTFSKIRKKPIVQGAPEHVLVYDIGAGTIDLTYFSIEQEGDRKKINIIGQMSKNSAGNYIDYVIAHSMFEQLGITPDKIATLSSNQKGDIKAYVKDELKIQVANYKSGGTKEIALNPKIQAELISYQQGSSQLDLSKLSAKLDEVFDENTDKLFNKFFNLFGSEKKHPLDTVIITGRSSRFPSLQDKIESTLKALSGNDDLFIIKNGDSKDDGYGYIDEKELKTIVALGALHYAALFKSADRAGVDLKRPELQARYGLLYGNSIEKGKEWQFCELLSPKPKKDTTKEPELIPVQGNTHFAFIQTYEEDPGGAYYNTETYEKNTDYITTIMEFSARDLDELGENISHIKPKVLRHHDGEMIFSITDHNDQELIAQKDDTPLRTSLTESDSFVKSMWPYFEKPKKEQE